MKEFERGGGGLGGKFTWESSLLGHILPSRGDEVADRPGGVFRIEDDLVDLDTLQESLFLSHRQFCLLPLEVQTGLDWTGAAGRAITPCFGAS